MKITIYYLFLANNSFSLAITFLAQLQIYIIILAFSSHYFKSYPS